MKSAFLQGCQLDREVVMKPPRAAKVPKGKLWKLKVPLYGLNDASLQFCLKCKKELQSLGCVVSSIDPGLFLKYSRDGQLEGFLVTHVDNFYHAGESKFVVDVVDKLLAIFLMDVWRIGGPSFHFQGCIFYVSVI